MEKCRYHNDSRTACTLMIDDFAEVAVTRNGMFLPCNDWGYGLDSSGSLWNYFENNLLAKYPEVKGTFFFATQNHKSQNGLSGYKILSKEPCKKLKAFTEKIGNRFELAFHGTCHGKYINPLSPEIKDNFIHEFEYVSRCDIPVYRREIERIEEFLDIRLTGGKYCGYKKNLYADSVIEHLGFKWWASSADMINRKHRRNYHSYWGIDYRVLDFPTNLTGCIFNRQVSRYPGSSFTMAFAKTMLNRLKAERHLQYLYDKGLIISIQEHFQNQRTDGRRQRHNIYDDIESLNCIFSFLKGSDTWFATCSEIAHYLESYDNTSISRIDENVFDIKYTGRWNEMFISLKSRVPKILHLPTGRVFHGIYKNRHWIFNSLPSGRFRVLSHQPNVV